MGEVKLGNKKPRLAASGVADDIDLTTPTSAESSPAARSPRPAPPVAGREATYRDYIPKTARIRNDQNQALTRLARELNSAKRDKSAPRITENTLIRVALDLLLERERDLRGETETAIRRSVQRHP